MLHTDQLTAAAPERIIAAQSLSSQEEQLERALRPKFLADYIGQHKAKEQLAIFIQAAKKRGEALDHTLLFGPTRTGEKPRWRTSSPKELGVNLRQTSGPCSNARAIWPRCSPTSNRTTSCLSTKSTAQPCR